jgi:hypothetical protein
MATNEQMANLYARLLTAARSDQTIHYSEAGVS